MTKEDVFKRIVGYTIRITRMIDHLPKEVTTEVISEQILRAAVSAGVNYRQASRSRLRKEFLNKMHLAGNGIDDTLFWFEYIETCEMIKPEKLSQLKKEGDELLSVISAGIRSAKEDHRVTVRKPAVKP
ncbi:MAG TPA: four helix bundle protein [Bacteroidales bacterium]|nr:four helix bundle protein [Bacteroidales bacterium]HPS74327.1 four helix bundle protein [Bacteroidales bacterium]